MPTLTPHQRATRQGIRAAQQEHQRLGTDLHGRVAIFETIEEERIWLMFRRLHNLYGAYKRQDGAAGIIINAQHPLTLQRFTAAHEYGHHVLGHLASADDVNRIERRSQDLQEVAAQAFAGEFLMPLQLVNYVLRTMGLKGKSLPLTSRQVYEVALELGVSYGAAVTQLVGQHIVTVPAGQKLRKQSPLALKTMLGGAKPLNPWADVWLLDEAQEGRELLPRLQDEIHVMLEENPSTGFVWTLAEVPSTALALVDDVFEEADEDEDVVGSAGRRHLRFRVASAGDARLRLEKKRPWQQDGKAVATFEATVHTTRPLTGDSEEGLARSRSARSLLAGRLREQPRCCVGCGLAAGAARGRDQGFTRGTCVAFAVTAAHEFHREAGGAVTDHLSEEALYWGSKMVDGQWRAGTRFTSAATALTNTGQPADAVWPYDENRPDGVAYTPPAPPDATWLKSSLIALTADVATVRGELDNGRPAVLGVVVYDTMFAPTAAGRVELPPAGAPSRGRHAVLAVGYDTDALLIRNSWGTTWALGGYGWLTDRVLQSAPA